MVGRKLPRRRLLGSLGSIATLGALAGCTEYLETTAETGPSKGEETEASDDETTEAPDETEEAESELDLREANVVGVEFESENGSYNFDVTLHHDDEGEDGYANWWQVERLDGTQLGRRDLLHPHSQQPFTRSETIDAPDGVTCVVVRGHDETHGYGGQAMLVNLESGATRAVEQGSDRQSLDATACP